MCLVFLPLKLQSSTQQVERTQYKQEIAFSPFPPFHLKSKVALQKCHEIFLIYIYFPILQRREFSRK